MTISTPIARFWVAASRSGRAKKSDWQAWADKLIEHQDAPDGWLIEMSLATNYRELRSALAPRLQEEVVNEAEDDDAALGHIWQRYEQGEIALAECLRNAGEEADGGSASIECEAIYLLLNELEATSDEMAVASKARVLFHEVQQIAESHWQALQAY